MRTANDRFKEGFGSWFWGSVVAATALHFLLFAFFPQLTSADYSMETQAFEAIDLPPEIEIPPPPEQISRPATPVVGDANIDEEITIATTTFEDNPIENLPPHPTSGASEDISKDPTFTTMTERPSLKNSDVVSRALHLN
jgi:hypothetical protein